MKRSTRTSTAAARRGKAVKSASKHPRRAAAKTAAANARAGRKSAARAARTPVKSAKRRVAKAAPVKSAERRVAKAAPVKSARRRVARAAPAKSAKRRASKPAPQRRAMTRASASLPRLHWTETLRDGTHMIVRPIDKQDADLERRFLERLSPESRRLRFLGLAGVPSEAMIRQLTDIDYERDMAFIALVHRENETRAIGISRYGTSADGKSCECAVAVADDWHHQGVATALMRHLIDVARARGIRSMASYDTIDNNEMHQLADYLGFERLADPDDPHMVIHRLAL